MSTVSNKIIQAASGSNGNGVTGEFIEVSGAASGNVTLSAAPQAGDLLIAGVGTFAGSVSNPSGFTSIQYHRSPNWNTTQSYYYESARVSYKIATGTEGTNINLGASRGGSLAVYRFNRPVTSVTKLNSTVTNTSANRTQTLAMQANYTTYPQLYICVSGAYNPGILTMTNQDFSNKHGCVSMAATLRPEDHTAVNNSITGSGSFTIAVVYGLIAPNFD